MTKKLFSIHHGACTGGSIISQILSASTNSVLISEINPFLQITDFNKVMFDPINLLKHLQANSKKLNQRQLLTFFVKQMDIVFSQTDRLNMNLFLRDHSHSTFNFKNINKNFLSKKWESKFLYALDFCLSKKSLYSQKFSKIRPIISIRHPLDSFISLRKKSWLEVYCQNDLTINEYCKGLLRFQKYFCNERNAIVIRYEDICNDFNLYLPKLSDKLNFEFKIPSIEQVNKIKVTGKSGRQSIDITLRPRDHDLIEANLIKCLESSSYYHEYCELNSYKKNHNDYPI